MLQKVKGSTTTAKIGVGLMAGAFGAGMLIASPASAAPAPNPQVRVTGEDEDAFVQLHLANKKAIVGTGWMNQIRTMKNKKKVKSNIVTGWLTIYGMRPNSAHIMYIGAGNCPGNRAAIGSTIPINTNEAGAWSGKVNINLGKRKAWVVRGKHHLGITAGAVPGGPLAACGKIRDDPNNGN